MGKMWNEYYYYWSQLYVSPRGTNKNEERKKHKWETYIWVKCRDTTQWVWPNRVSLSLSISVYIQRSWLTHFYLRHLHCIILLLLEYAQMQFCISSGRKMILFNENSFIYNYYESNANNLNEVNLSRESHGRKKK